MNVFLRHIRVLGHREDGFYRAELKCRLHSVHSAGYITAGTKLMILSYITVKAKYEVHRAN